MFCAMNILALPRDVLVYHIFARDCYDLCTRLRISQTCKTLRIMYQPEPTIWEVFRGKHEPYYSHKLLANPQLLSHFTWYITNVRKPRHQDPDDARSIEGIWMAVCRRGHIAFLKALHGAVGGGGWQGHEIKAIIRQDEPALAEWILCSDLSRRARRSAYLVDLAVDTDAVNVLAYLIHRAWQGRISFDADDVLRRAGYHKSLNAFAWLLGHRGYTCPQSALGRLFEIQNSDAPRTYYTVSDMRELIRLIQCRVVPLTSDTLDEIAAFQHFLNDRR
jgi:hypothetical protein